jgi:hypothetical protein
MFWSTNQKSKSSPRAKMANSNVLFSQADIILETRKLLSGLNVGDVFVRDSNTLDTLTITSQESDNPNKFDAVIFISDLNLTIEVHVTCKPNGKFIIKENDSSYKIKLTSTPVADTNPQKFSVTGKLTLKESRTIVLVSNELYSLQIT